ncbi:gibberellin 3-beta-dioxygenase 1 [Dorcoceras hygrometricum]|uniref:gibberellin 3beta-dioxygenase n=1 Tax=Dorcoceras hygrometricum TaxID=472368 RepID=A0A2Z7BI78_9LAMI|nr:gibberellin 3-beta-dioxygenase 1 [Dorcoceras hygrometricum]
MATTLSEAYRDTPLQLKHIIPLDFDSIHYLPESHVWTESVDLLSVDESDVPIIDLHAPDAVELVGNACRKWGMFQVINHGVPRSLLGDAESHVRRLFGLPAHRKLQALRSPGGATGYGVARISPFFSKLMWHEGFTIMGSSLEHAKLLWPQDYEEFCSAMDNYQKQMKSLAYKILVLILKSLEAKDEKTLISTASFQQSEGALQLNSYPCCPNHNQAIGLAPHTDSLLLTILHQNDTKGLQVLRENTGWITVPPVSEALVVNIGDLLNIVSNGQFPTVYHRVVPNETRHRFSMAYFYGPPVDSTVAPLSNLGSPRYRSVTVKEYLSIKNKHLDKAIPLLKTG